MNCIHSQMLLHMGESHELGELVHNLGEKVISV
jgi:hypothetical protein